MVRINKYLAQCNLGSRRSVEKLILDRKVTVNDNIVDNLSLQINPEVDVIKFEGKEVVPKSENIYLMLNKPKKYLVSKKDDFDRRLIYDLLPDFGTNLFYIGRLDYMSEGLLLLTNDGDFAEKIIHPRFKLEKVYKVKIKGRISDSSIEQLRTGIILNGKKTKPAIVFVNSVKNNTTTLKITIFEGRKRQIRYMLKSVGSEVLDLKRLQIGNVKLNKLPLGMWRMLKPSEVTSLLQTSKINTKRK